jgi:hypothetical protein
VWRDVSDDAKRFVAVPDSKAPVEETLRFASSYDAYEIFAREPAELEHIAQPIYDDIARSGRVPDWLGVDLARAVLFYAYRSDYFSGSYGPYEPMRTLVGGIRRLSGGLVERRVRSVSRATQETSADPPSLDFVDNSEYSEDHIYRWWYERRWAEGPSLCFVGLNPATGDTDRRQRPTLHRVVGWGPSRRMWSRRSRESVRLPRDPPRGPDVGRSRHRR